MKWDAWQWDMELNRRTKPLFLRSLEPEEELASFVSQRAHCLEAHERFDEAWGCYNAALRLAPHNDSYGHWAKQVHKAKLNHALKPWRMTAAAYLAKLKERHSGGGAGVVFPWGEADAPPYELPADALRSTEGVPFQSPIADPFAAAGAAIGVGDIRRAPIPSASSRIAPVIDILSMPQ